MTIRKISNARVYVNGGDTTGTCKALELPEVEAEQMEISGPGMVGTVELPTKLGPMEATITWHHFPPEFIDAMSDFTKTSQIVVKGDQAVYSSEGSPIAGSFVATLRGRPKTFASGSLEEGETPEPETTLAVDYYSLVVDGATICEYDAAASAGAKVGGGVVSLVGALGGLL